MPYVLLNLYEGYPSLFQEIMFMIQIHFVSPVSKCVILFILY